MNLSLLMLPGTFVQQNYDQRLQSINQMTFFQKRQFLLLKFYVSDQKALPVVLVLVSGWCFFFSRSYLHWQKACSIRPFQRVVLQSGLYSLISLRKKHKWVFCGIYNFQIVLNILNGLFQIVDLDIFLVEFQPHSLEAVFLFAIVHVQ